MPQAPSIHEQRTYVSGRFELEIDGVPCGLLNAIDGGHFKSEAVAEQVGGDKLVTRYPGRQKFEDITVTIGSAMSKQFWDWVKAFIEDKPVRRSGAIVARDFNNRERSRRTFFDAIISEVQFPQLDLKSKNPKHLTVKISPERIGFSGGSQSKPPQGPGGNIREQKKQTPQNFGFAIEGIDSHITKRVVKIDAFSVKQNVINAPVGGLLYAPKEIGRIEYPTISIYTPEAFAGPWIEWWEQFVGKGEHVGRNERTGAITYMNSNFTNELMRIDLRGVGITSLTFDKLEAQTEQIRNVKIDLYVEQLDLQKR